MSVAGVSLIELETLCYQEAVWQNTDVDSFGPTPKQIYFFILIWLLKHKGSCQCAEDLLAGQDVVTLTKRVQLVAHHLGEWGAVITELKQGDENEWELLRLQLERAVKYYPGPSQELKKEALQIALIKHFDLLRKMVTWQELEEIEVTAFVLSQRTRLTNLYDFSSPFYAFAKRLGRNELISQLRKADRDRGQPFPSEEIASPGSAQLLTSLLFEEEGLEEGFRRQLKSDLIALLALIQQVLTPRLIQVILKTLSMRKEFWRALEVAGLTAPIGFSPDASLATDRDIADHLAITENTLRVHRTYARKTVRAKDPVLASLLESLITRERKISYRPVIESI